MFIISLVHLWLLLLRQFREAQEDRFFCVKVFDRS